MNARSRSTFRLLLASLLTVAVFLTLAALGVWQLERRVWKHALIAHVEARVHAAPIAAPGPALWRDISTDKDAYRRVAVQGRYLNDQETYVQAATIRGSGYWVLTPLRTSQGFTVLINRGFVPPEKRKAHSQIATPATVTGLLRVTEPKGGFLRSNDPAQNRWYSRDVAGIARARKLPNVAPYFIDADASDRSRDAPVGGLTVLSFPDNHLAYAFTWFAMALMALGGGALFVREELRRGWRAATDA